ncbi:hypothetical protein ACEPAG_32 [Sanghuangporus baumii]
MHPGRTKAISSSESTVLQDVKKLSLPSDAEKFAITPAYQSAQLDIKYPEVFNLWIIYVNRLGDWKENDLWKPENRVEITTSIGDTGIFLQTLHDELNRSRTVNTSLLDQFPEFRDRVEQAVPGFLTPTVSMPPDAIVTPTELQCYVDIFDNIADGVSKFQPGGSESSLQRSLFFGSMMIQPAFFWDQHPSLEKIEMTAGRTSGLQMFIKPNDQPEIYKFTPKNDISVIEISSSLPALICELDSRASQKSCTELISQSVAACRQWRCILPEALKEKNRFLALFIHDDFKVALYLFHADKNNSVKIFQQGFSLGRRNEALRLTRILFNYRDKFLDIAGLPEPGKIQQIKRLVSDSEILPSFTTTTIEKTESSDNSRQSSEQPTHVATSETRINPLLLSDKVKSLCPDGTYLQATEHEYVAAVRITGIPPKTLGFIKLTNKHELHAFNAIRNSGSEFLLSRVVLPIKVVEIDECQVAFLPYGGEPLRKSWRLQDGPVGHETEIAWDLLAIISRLHELRIAHLDIRPANVLWDPSTHSIRVIDFGSSKILDPNGSRNIRGSFGTSDFARPELELKEALEYDPFLIDTFSCGQVLSDVVMAERMTDEAKFVLEVSRSLMKEDVNERWSISKAMQVWADWLKERGRPEYTR